VTGGLVYENIASGRSKTGFRVRAFRPEVCLEICIGEDVMRRILLVAIAFCLGLGVATALAQRPREATQVDPEVHHVAMENDHVRVLEVRAPVGYTSPMHSHPPVLAVSIGSGRLKITSQDGQSQIVDTRPGMVFWFDDARHTWELLAGTHHFIAVEVKAAKAAAGE
jgi:hypothetical protein